MARNVVTQTVPGTVAHGVVVKDGKAKPASFELDGCNLSAKSAETRVRKTLDNTFCIDAEIPVTYYAKIYTMPLDTFVKQATVEIIEK